MSVRGCSQRWACPSPEWRQRWACPSMGWRQRWACPSMGWRQRWACPVPGGQAQAARLKATPKQRPAPPTLMRSTSLGFTEIFVATHDAALKRAAALDGGAAAAPGAVRIPEISDFEVERLGDLAGAAESWAGEEDMPFGAEQAAIYVRQLAELAAGIDPATKAGLYVWTN